MDSDLIDLAPAARAGPAMLSATQAEAIVRLVESAPQVRRRYQFYAWAQTHLQTLLPHPVAVCGAYRRQQRTLAFEALHSVVLPAPLLAVLTDSGGPLLRPACAAWIEGRGRPLALELSGLAGEAHDAGRRLRQSCGTSTLLVHGVSRPQRPAELETLFLFACTAPTANAPLLLHLDLLLPHLHSTWLRVVATESDMPGPGAAPGPAAAPDPAALQRQPITERERQILAWVREGKSNHEIAVQLAISPLTVKNHVQKILRKLGAANRAQAVALAMSLDLLGRSGNPQAWTPGRPGASR